MKITLATIGIILSLGSFIFGIFEVPKRIKEFRLLGKVDYNPQTGSCAPVETLQAIIDKAKELAKKYNKKV